MLTQILTLLLAASPTPESLIKGFHEADGGKVSVVSAKPPLPDGAHVGIQVSKAGLIKLTYHRHDERVGEIVLALHPKRPGLGSDQFFVEVTKRPTGEKPLKLSCSGHPYTNTRYEPMLGIQCYLPEQYGKERVRSATDFALTLEATTLVIQEGAYSYERGGSFHYRVTRPAAEVAKREAWWARFMRRVDQQQSLPRTAQVAPLDTSQWTVIPDVEARVAVDGLKLRVEYVGAKAPSTYLLEAMPDWISEADDRLLALRMTAPGSKPRVCPFVPAGDKKKAFDLSGERFAIIGPCYFGLTKERFASAKGSVVGLDTEPEGTTRDGWIQITVDDTRLMLLTAPAPSAFPKSWVRQDSAK